MLTRKTPTILATQFSSLPIGSLRIQLATVGFIAWFSRTGDISDQVQRGGARNRTRRSENHLNIFCFDFDF